MTATMTSRTPSPSSSSHYSYSSSRSHVSSSPCFSSPLSVVSFLTPSQLERVSYRTCKRRLAKALHDDIANFADDGMLLETTEKGVWYPVVHVAGLSPQAFLSAHDLLRSSNSLGKDFVLQQGLYREIRFMEPYTGELESAKLKRRLDSLDDHPLAYVFLGFTGLSWGLVDRGNGEARAMEDSWKDWTGVRYLHLNLPDDFGLSRVALLRRVAAAAPTTNDAVTATALFTYIVLVELTNINAKNEVLLSDFVHRFRAERAKGYLSVYREAPLLGSVSSSDRSNSANGYYSTGSASGDDVGSEEYPSPLVVSSSTDNNNSRRSVRQMRNSVFL